ncbi:MAG: hypothetical protein ABEJ24_00480 [Candidatus Magasanikbacteria bacterium]
MKIKTLILAALSIILVGAGCTGSGGSDTPSQSESSQKASGNIHVSETALKGDVCNKLMPKDFASKVLGFPASALKKAKNYCVYTGKSNGTYAKAYLNYRRFEDKKTAMNWFENETSGKTSEDVNPTQSSEGEREVSGVGDAAYFTGSSLRVVLGNVLLKITAFTRPTLDPTNFKNMQKYAQATQEKRVSAEKQIQMTKQIAQEVKKNLSEL